MKNTLPLIILLALFCGCNKEGPIGPGTATTNNITSFTSTVSNWTQNGNIYYANITAPGITQAVLDSGAVVVYRVGVNSLNQTYYEAMPYTDANAPISYIDYLNLGNVQINIQNAPSYPPSLQFKIVIINDL